MFSRPDESININTENKNNLETDDKKQQLIEQ